MDDRCEALVRFVGPHGDAFELFELAEKVLDEVTPFVHLGVDARGFARRGCCEMTILAPRCSWGDRFASLSTR
ncbi:hypothetical protein [Mesorhizobium sp.]|uniref:hypothetical protein n=1 Tax=unclassified Mesorhizobium TaxID=325217 RepID=UPI00351A7CEA